MSRNLNLRQDIINQIIDDIASQLLSSPLPSQSELANLYNVSRTTIRHAIEYLLKTEIIRVEEHRLYVARLPSAAEK
ncbi:MAG TPA: GntR family transcriptional regulator, partial [Pasteurellaceae bacterium]|nr:GntR family transcriptional regulator [Pasteurellaceae bacterium]